MGFIQRFHQFWNKQSNQPDQFIKDKPLWTDGDHSPVNVEYKMHLSASELTSNQELIDSVVEKIIQQDYSKRQYGGREEKEFSANPSRVYQYETYQTQAVKLVPTSYNHLDVYFEDTFLGKLPQEYTEDTTHFLQSTVFMAFAYVKGGPYKVYDEQTKQIKTGKEPFDINLYIQFS